MKLATAKHPFIQRRLWRYCFIGKRCFNDKFGFFIVKKAWEVSRYTANIDPHAHIDIKVQIETTYGKLIMMVHHVGNYQLANNQKGSSY